MKIPSQMIAAILYGPDDLRVVQTDTPKPQAGEVLIKVMACAICGSDISLIHQAWPGQPAYGEFIPGHEYSGQIVALGPDVDEFKLGDRVAVEAHKGCGRCINCRTGKYTCCLNYGNLSRGHRANGFTTNGGYAQYVVNHVSTVYKLTDNIGYDEASLVTTAGCPLYGFEAAGGILGGENVLVTGPGPIGLMTVQIAKALSAGKVILTGTRDSRLETGKQLGADYCLKVSQDDPAERIKQITNEAGIDVAVECSGSQEAVVLAIQTVKKAGRVILLGFPPKPVPVDLATVAKNNLTIYGIRGEGLANCARALELMALGKIKGQPLITHTFPLSKVNQALDTFTKRIDGAIKVVLKPQE